MTRAMATSPCRSITLFLILLWGSTILFLSSSAELQRFTHPAKSDGSLSLLAVGDWGRRGTYNQSQVAYQMGRIGEELDIDFVISVGDNFYESGLTGVNDTAFIESFSNIYTAKSLQKQWYSVLGNHDYRGNAVAQLDPVLQILDNRWLCMRSFMVDAEFAHFFFVDTTPFVEKYWTHPKDNHYDWREVAPREEYIKGVLEDLDSALKESMATWKIVIGHHTIRSVSDHGDTIELVNLLLPVLKAYGVDLYINGHDHCLEHIRSTDSPIQFLTSGGGSKAWRGIFTPTTEKLQFFHDGQGFISLHLTKTDAEVVFYDVFGSILHRWNMNKLLHSFM
ncbi:purple acid phosphatase 17-like isoform X1 [Elaeis guineensis]|uniref:purple acid phosphatase 17-like isoform X1 n=1 Tax=Elaeis guineensis var. tenera TaxID=51953 RepID=UPI003C6DAEAA